MPGTFPGGKKRPVRKADNLPSSCAVMKYGNFNFLESSGPVMGLLFYLAIFFLFTFKVLFRILLSIFIDSENLLHTKREWKHENLETMHKFRLYLILYCTQLYFNCISTVFCHNINFKNCKHNTVLTTCENSKSWSICCIFHERLHEDGQSVGSETCLRFKHRATS